MNYLEKIESSKDVLAMFSKMLFLNEKLKVDIRQDKSYGYINYRDEGLKSNVVIKISNDRLENLSMIDISSKEYLVLYDKILRSILEHKQEKHSYNLICID